MNAASLRIRFISSDFSEISKTICLVFFKVSFAPIRTRAQIIDKLRSYVEEIAPHSVFTLYPNDTHQDHRNVSKVTISSCKNVNEVLFYEISSTERDFHPNVFYDVTDYFNLKEKSLRCHKTQRKKSYLNLTEIRGLAEYRAYQCGCNGRLFEAFCLYRVIK